MNEGGLFHIVDDEESVRRSLEFLLRTAGYRVECWPDGECFLSGADKFEPACALLDMRMPGIDGIQVQERMVTAGLDFPVIMLTGHGDVSLAVRAMQAGASDFIEKPFERDALLRALGFAFRQIADRECLRERSQSARAQIARLTDREREVLDGLACGYPNKTTTSGSVLALWKCTGPMS